MKESILRLIEGKLGLSHSDYTENSRFVEDLDCDSLDKLELVMECEKEFNVLIPDDALMDINTINDLITYIEKHRS